MKTPYGTTCQMKTVDSMFLEDYDLTRGSLLHPALVRTSAKLMYSLAKIL